MNKTSGEKIHEMYAGASYKPKKINEALDGVFNIYKNDIDFGSAIDNLKEKMVLDIPARYGDDKTKNELFKTIFKFGAFQNIVDTTHIKQSNMPHEIMASLLAAIDRGAIRLIDSSAVSKDLASMTVANKEKVLRQMILPQIIHATDKIINNSSSLEDVCGLDKPPRIAGVDELKSVVSYLTDLTKITPYSDFVDPGVFAEDKFIKGHASKTDAVVFSPIEYRRETALQKAANATKKEAIQNVASIFEQIETNLAGKVFDGTTQTPLALMAKAIGNSKNLPNGRDIKFNIGTSVDRSQITVERLKHAIQNIKDSNWSVLGLDYETIGDQLQEYAYHHGRVDKQTKKFTPNKKSGIVHGFVGNMSEHQGNAIGNIVNSYIKNGVKEEDSDYILRRFWAIGKSIDDLVEEKDEHGSSTGRYFFNDFADVDKADLSETDIIEAGYKKWMEVGEKQKKSLTKVQVCNDTYEMMQWEADNLTKLHRAMSNGSTIVAHNGMRFDTSKVLTAMTRFGSRGAKQYMLDQGIYGLKDYQYFLDPQEVLHAINSNADDPSIVRKISDAGTTFNTNTALQIRTNTEANGTAHMATADVENMMNAVTTAIFNPENSSVDFSSFAPEKIGTTTKSVGVGSIFTFDTSYGVMNTSNVGGLMFSKDQISGAYRLGGSGMSVSKTDEGLTVNDKDFGAYFQKDAPYVITGIQKYNIEDKEGFYKDALVLDSSVASKEGELYAVKVARILTGADTNKAKQKPVYLVGSKNTIETLLSSIGNNIGGLESTDVNDLDFADSIDAEALKDSRPALYNEIQAKRDALKAESDKKPLEKINTRAYSSWNNITKTIELGGQETSLLRLFTESSNIAELQQDIIGQLHKDNKLFGFTINSENQFYNLTSTINTLNSINEAGRIGENGLFNIFDSKVSAMARNVESLDRDKMFSDFYHSIKKNVFNLMQGHIDDEKFSIKPSQEYIDAHFEFDLSPVTQRKGVHAKFDSDFSSESVVFDIASENTANKENWKAADKLTRIYGLGSDRKAEAMLRYISHLENYFGVSRSIPKEDFAMMTDSVEALINYAVNTMRKIRQGKPTKNKDTGEIEYKKNYKDNTPRTKIIDDIDDNTLMEAFSQMDEKTKGEIIDRSFDSTKTYRKSFTEQQLKDAVTDYVEKNAISGFGGVSLATDESAIEVVKGLVRDNATAEKIISIANGLKQNRDNMRNTTLNIVKALFPFPQNKDGKTKNSAVKYGDIPVSISERGIILGSTEAGKGYELNISDYMPKMRWNDTLQRSEMYLGNIPILDYDVTYRDEKGNIKLGTVVDKVLSESAYDKKLRYLSKIKDPRDKLNYVKGILSNIGKEFRKYSGLKNTNEELRMLDSFDYGEIYDSIINAFTNQDDGARHELIDIFNKAVDKNNPLGAEDIRHWAESFKNITNTRISVRQGAILKQNISKIFDVITSDDAKGGLNDLIFGMIDPETAEKISSRLAEMDIATRHANRHIGYLDSQSAAFEHSGAPHKRQENVAQKRAKTINLEALRKYANDRGYTELANLYSTTKTLIHSATEPESQRMKKYDTFTIDMPQEKYQALVHSDFNNPDVTFLDPKKIIADMDMYIGESNSISNPHLMALDEKMSVQRIHREALLEQDKIKYIDGTESMGEKGRRKDLDFVAYLTEGDDGKGRIKFSYGRTLYMRKGQKMFTLQAYPEDSTIAKARNGGTLSGRFYETVQGVQREVSSDRINDILNESAIQTQIANAIRDNGSKDRAEMQKLLNEQIINVLKNNGIRFNYVLKEDTVGLGRKLSFTGEKSYTTYALSPTGRYFEGIRKFFKGIGMSDYLDVHLSQDFIDNITVTSMDEDPAKRITRFNPESALYLRLKEQTKEYNKKLDEGRDHYRSSAHKALDKAKDIKNKYTKDLNKLASDHDKQKREQQKLESRKERLEERRGELEQQKQDKINEINKKLSRQDEITKRIDDIEEEIKNIDPYSDGAEKHKDALEEEKKRLYAEGWAIREDTGYDKPDKKIKKIENRYDKKIKEIDKKIKKVESQLIPNADNDYNNQKGYFLDKIDHADRIIEKIQPRLIDKSTTPVRITPESILQVALKDAFGEGATPQTLVSMLNEERTYMWDRGIVPMFQGILGKNAIDRFTLGAVTSTGAERVKDSHAETANIIESIGHAYEALFISAGKTLEEAKKNARKFIAENVLVNPNDIDIETGEVSSNARIDTQKIASNEKIGLYNNGTGVTYSSNEAVQIKSNIRLIRDTVMHLLDSDSSVGSLVDKNRGFMYSTRIHTSLAHHVFDQDAITDLANIYHDKHGMNFGEIQGIFDGIARISARENGSLVAELTEKGKNGLVYGDIINSILNQVMNKGRAVTQVDESKIRTKLEADGKSEDEISNAIAEGKKEAIANDRSYIKSITNASEKHADMIYQAAVDNHTSLDRAITSYSIRSLALADKAMKVQELTETEANESVKIQSSFMQEHAERFAKDHDLPIYHISEINTDKLRTVGSSKSIYNGGNFMIDLGENSQFWVNGKRYIMNSFVPNSIIGDDVENNISTKMQDGIAQIKNIYDRYVTNGKDIENPELRATKIESAMSEASTNFTEGLRTLLSGKDSIANLSTKVVLDRSFNAKVQIAKAYEHFPSDYNSKPIINQFSAIESVIGKYGVEAADTSIFVGKAKAIELLGGEKHIRSLAEEKGVEYDDMLGSMLKEMGSTGMLVTAKREPTNYRHSSAGTRAFFDVSVGENQVKLGETIAAFMKADSDGDIVSVAPILDRIQNTSMTNIEAKIIGNNEQESKLFRSATLAADLLAHGSAAKALRMINNTAAGNNESLTYGEKLFQQVIGTNDEPGKIMRYSINGTMIDYTGDVDRYNELGKERQADVNIAFNEFRQSDNFKKIAGELKIDTDTPLSSDSLIRITNAHLNSMSDEERANFVGSDLEIGVRAEAARMVAREKVEADMMQGNAGIVNTETNRARNLIEDLKNAKKLGMSSQEIGAVYNLLSEIDEKGQAPKNHGEPADLDKLSEAFSHLYRRSPQYARGEISAANNAEMFVNTLEEAIGSNIGDLKKTKEIFIEGQENMSADELAAARRQYLINALRKLLPENERITKEYFQASKAYIQNSGSTTPSWTNIDDVGDPLKKTVNMAAQMSEDMDNGEKLFGTVSITEKMPAIRKRAEEMESTAEVVQKHIEREITPDYRGGRYTPEASDIDADDIPIAKAGMREGAANIARGIGSALKSSKGILGLAGAIMAAGFIGGNPTAPSGTEAMQTVQDSQPYEIQSVNMQPQIHQQAPQGYIINVNASSDKGQDYISGLMQQTMRSQFPNQNINMTMNINDSSSNISFRDVASYLMSAI